MKERPDLRAKRETLQKREGRNKKLKMTNALESSKKVSSLSI